MKIRQIIQEHTDKIVEGDFEAPENDCKNCRRKPYAFRLHESRKRQLGYTVGDIVEIAATFLLRWKCMLCGATFTQYPPFVLPYKRFVLPEIVRPSRKYLEDEHASYADTVAEDGIAIGYRDERGFCESFVSRSTVWRFMNCLASLHVRNNETKNAELPRPFWLPPRKYRSDERLRVLIRAFEAIAQLRQGSFFRPFPDLETVEP